MLSGKGSQTCKHLKLGDLLRRHGTFTITEINLKYRNVDSILSLTKCSRDKLFLHFLVVLTCNEEGSIVVEKLKKPCCNGYVGVSRLVGKAYPRIPSVQLSGVEVEIQKLVDLIHKHNTRYNPLSSNCWEFGTEFAVDVVELLLDYVAANSDDEDSLKRGLDKLKNQERPSPASVFRYIFYPVKDNKNVTTHRILEKKAEGCRMSLRILLKLMKVPMLSFGNIITQIVACFKKIGSCLKQIVPRLKQIVPLLKQIVPYLRVVELRPRPT